MTEETCRNCRFRTAWSQTDQTCVCRRYPEPRDKGMAEWCGEWMPRNEDAEPPTTYYETFKADIEEIVKDCCDPRIAPRGVVRRLLLLFCGHGNASRRSPTHCRSRPASAARARSARFTAGARGPSLALGAGLARERLAARPGCASHGAGALSISSLSGRRACSAMRVGQRISTQGGPDPRASRREQRKPQITAKAVAPISATRPLSSHVGQSIHRPMGIHAQP